MKKPSCEIKRNSEKIVKSEGLISNLSQETSLASEVSHLAFQGGSYIQQALSSINKHSKSNFNLNKNKIVATCR